MKKKHTRTKPDSVSKGSRKKSATVALTLLSALAIAVIGCNSEPPKEKSPYDDYLYAGKASDSGMVYSHYHNGFMQWYLMSRMFNGYGYGFGGYHYYRSSPGYFTTTGGIGEGHASVSRGGFGSIGHGSSAG